MGKLLAWGGALFLVHCERGKLQIQRVDVNADEKKALLRICSVKDDGDAVLPVNARLVAAKEVEDIEIATRYPVLVFQASGKNDTELTNVYVMRNPLQHTHLRALQIVLRSMRQEILASQQQKSKEKLVGEYATHRKQRRKTKDQDPASIHRSMQRDTDLYAIRLLQELQKRANFHTMWFDANQNVK
ncbi:hypothetical protein JG688_00001122 [Phytophthora aleatoria]|uniref:Uncharacterized protein n=1 Tax=Phytophthora aleatoria TaxID=2496075 RepID=A0A8J5J4F6_9STRA|nr:hypothetical protein JG688_00001122 [Phytophthora aleatoria]